MQVFNADKTGVMIVHKPGTMCTVLRLLKGAIPILFCLAFQPMVSCYLVAQYIHEGEQSPKILERVRQQGLYFATVQMDG